MAVALRLISRVLFLLGALAVAAGCQPETEGRSDAVGLAEVPRVMDTSAIRPGPETPTIEPESVAVRESATAMPTRQSKAPSRAGAFTSSQGFVFAGVSESDFGDFLLGASVGNTGKMNTMVDLGLVQMIPNGTRGEIVAEGSQMGRSLVAVKLLNGVEAGKVVWALKDDFSVRR